MQMQCLTNSAGVPLAAGACVITCPPAGTPAGAIPTADGNGGFTWAAPAASGGGAITSTRLTNVNGDSAFVPVTLSGAGNSYAWEYLDMAGGGSYATQALDTLPSNTISYLGALPPGYNSMWKAAGTPMAGVPMKCPVGTTITAANYAQYL